MPLSIWLRGLAAVLLAPGAAVAAQPEPWQIGFQPAATPVMAQIQDFNVLVTVIIIAVAVFVTGLLLFVMWRFSAKRNPAPSKTTHNTLLELIWTAVPTVILLILFVPSFNLLYFMDRAADAEMTIKAIGYQWYWSYEYPDHGDLTFDALMVADDELKPGQVRLLETDNRIVLPVDTTIRVLVTAADVIHSWAVPAFGVKTDAVPGRLNETWIRIEREGVYYGQCSELCGTLHGFMPITVEAVSKDAFAAWVEKVKVEFARQDAPAATTVARAAPDDASTGQGLPK